MTKLHKGGEGGHDIAGDPPELWKTIGDEVLFTKRIDHPGQAGVCLLVWIETLNELREMLKEYKLDVKATAWLADFPIRNNEIILQKNAAKALSADEDQHYIFSNQTALDAFYSKSADDPANEILRDFIGPSIDTGFRLGAFASERKLVMSVELAYVVAGEQVRAGERRQIYNLGIFVMPDFNFKYEGRHSLKGVLGGAPYPIIWIDLAPDNPVFRAEDTVLRTPSPSAAEILALAKSFIESHSFLSLPYIAECAFEEYRTLKTEDISLLLNRYRSINKVRESLVIEKEAPALPDLAVTTSDVSVIDLEIKAPVG